MLEAGVIAALAMASSGPTCFAAARDLPVGTELTASDLTLVTCRATPGRARVRYDRSRRAPIAAAAITAGTYLGSILLPEEGRVQKGEVLTLRSTAGPVTVERSVTTMQPARAGGRVFVRDSEGNIFAAPMTVRRAQ